MFIIKFNGLFVVNCQVRECFNDDGKVIHREVNFKFSDDIRLAYPMDCQELLDYIAYWLDYKFGSLDSIEVIEYNG